MKLFMERSVFNVAICGAGRCLSLEIPLDTVMFIHGATLFVCRVRMPHCKVFSLCPSQDWVRDAGKYARFRQEMAFLKKYPRFATLPTLRDRCGPPQTLHLKMQRSKGSLLIENPNISSALPAMWRILSKQTMS